MRHMAFEKTNIARSSESTSYRRAKLVGKLHTMRAGMAALLPDGQHMVIGGRSDCTREDLLSDIDAVLATFKAADDLTVQLAVLRAAEPTLLAHVVDALRAFEGLMRAYLGPSSSQLLKVGLKPASPRRRLTPEELLAAHVRSTETRKIRRTLGKNQKKALKSGPVTVKVETKK